MQTIAYIPVRKGSTRIKDKWLAPYRGKPLYEHTTDQAAELLGNGIVDEVVVSTDSVVLRGRCAALGFRCLAAHSVDEYAQHEARMGVLLPCYQESITIVMLQITSPERTTQQVEDALSLYAETVFRHPGKTAAAFSCFVTCGLYWRDSGPSGLTPNYDINDRPRSQDFDPRDTMIYHENGAIYIFGSEALRANPLSRLGADVVVPFVMPYTSSLDIDCYGDLK